MVTKVENNSKHIYQTRFAETSRVRTNLNDLLERAKLEKKAENRINFLIYSCAGSVFAVVLLILSFWNYLRFLERARKTTHKPHA